MWSSVEHKKKLKGKKSLAKVKGERKQVTRANVRSCRSGVTPVRFPISRIRKERKFALIRIACLIEEGDSGANHRLLQGLHELLDSDRFQKGTCSKEQIVHESTKKHQR